MMSRPYLFISTANCHTLTHFTTFCWLFARHSLFFKAVPVGWQNLVSVSLFTYRSDTMILCDFVFSNQWCLSPTAHPPTFRTRESLCLVSNFRAFRHGWLLYQNFKNLTSIVPGSLNKHPKGEQIFLAWIFKWATAVSLALKILFFFFLL